MPVIDATGLVALENAIDGRVRQQEARVILAGPLPRPREVFDKAGLDRKYPGLRIVHDVDAAIALAESLLAARNPPPTPPPPPPPS